LKRPLLYLAGASLLALLFAAAGALAWLIGTPAGARWLLESVLPRTGLKITVRQVDGRLLDHLRLAGVHVAAPPVEGEITSLDLRWRPLLLLSGKVAVTELALRGVRLQDNTPPTGKAPDLAWPRVVGIAELLEGRIDLLRLEDFRYRHLDESPVEVANISTSLDWRDTLLSLNDLAVAAPAGRLTGRIVAGLHTPSLQLDLAVIPPRPVAEFDRLTVRASLHHARPPEQLAGSVTVAGATGAKKRLELSGEVGMTRNSFNLRALRLAGPALEGTVSGAGRFVLTAGEPLAELQLQTAALRLPAGLPIPVEISGELTFSGNLERYRGRFALANRGKGWPAGRLTGSFQGDGGGVKLAPLEISLLDGAGRGNLDVEWHEGLALRGAVELRGLNPAGIAPDWTGEVNLDVAGNVAWPETAPVHGEVHGNLRQSTLHGQPLTGEVSAEIAGDNLRVASLVLRGKGFDISAAGGLKERLTFTARVGDLSRLIPDTAGELDGQGWVRWHAGSPSGMVTGRGRNLAAAGVRAATAEVAARLEEGKEHPVQATVALGKAGYGRFQADSAKLQLTGTQLKNRLAATFRSADAELELALAGSYRSGLWQGEIESLSGRDRSGAWGLTVPAPLAISATKVTLASLVLTGGPRERLSAAGGLTFDPPAGSLRGEWEGLDLSRLDPWLKEATISGASSGRVQIRLLAGERLTVTGSAEARGTVTTGGHRVTVEHALLHLDGGERGIQAGIDLSLAEGGTLKGTFSSTAPARLAFPGEGELSAEWRGLDLARLNPWLKEATASGVSSGNVQLRLQAGERLAVTGSAEARGTVTTGGQQLTVEHALLHLDGGERGIQAGIELSLAEGGTLKGAFSSSAAARLAFPGEGELSAEWTGLDLVLLRPWLPNTVNLEGHLAGGVKGKLLPGGRFDLRGDAALAGGKAHWLRAGGELNAGLRSVTLSWSWQEEALRGDFKLALTEYGEGRGNFRLPLPARFPTSLDEKGEIQATLSGDFSERGLLSSLFPGFIQESNGELGCDLQVGGTWKEPRMTGTLRLAKAGGYLPPAGVRVSDIQLAARLEKELISVDSFRVAASPGHLTGKGVIRLKGWEVTGYQGEISGERCRAIYLPELQMLVTPRLTFEGTPEKLAVRGVVSLPELLVSGTPGASAVAPSKDVILEGAAAAGAPLPFALDIQVRVELGDRVLVKAAGIDAQLGGGVDLAFRDLDRITSKGDIRVIKGNYRTYGVDLDIVRGHLFYAGGPIGRPTLDFLALRTVADVRAGVTVTGAPQAPVIKLYSEPAMPDVDILAYIVLGHPLGSSREQAGMVAQAAGVLLSASQSVSLQDQIKNRLGLSTLELQTAGQTPGYMGGYKPIAVTPPGGTPARTAAGLAQTMVTVGKYLTPELYLSYGRSLFTGGNLVRLRYDLFRHWQIETQTGSESGADLYYKIDFE
jgi:translocation and assembly module TamB